MTAEEEIAEDEPAGMNELIKDDEGDCFYFNFLWWKDCTSWDLQILGKIGLGNKAKDCEE